MSMLRTTMDGKAVSVRTANMIRRAEKRLGHNLRIVQGSYNSGGVSASAGTHDGGGAVDFSTIGIPDVSEAVLQLRKVGFAAWHRKPSQGPWVDHIHCIAIGDPELSRGAKFQVDEYYRRNNGLASRGADDGPIVDPIPVWPVPLGEISLTRLQNQFSAQNKRKVAAVRRVQSLLNYRIDAGLRVDGIAGSETKAAWKRWEKNIGAKTPDTHPTEWALKKLVAGYYRVIK